MNQLSILMVSRLAGHIAPDLHGGRGIMSQSPASVGFACGML
jgi:hypothetical protein